MVGIQTHKDPLFAQTILTGVEWVAMLFLMLLQHVYSLQNSDEICLCFAIMFYLILITVSF